MTSQGETLVFTPIEASNAAENYVAWKRENKGGGMPLYIPKMEYNAKDGKGFLPVMRGELISVIGRPGCGKTGFMLRWARQRAKDLQKQAALGSAEAAKSVVLYVTMEQTVEELRLFNVAAEREISSTDMASGQIEDWQPITDTLRTLHSTPLWFVGKSASRRKSKVHVSEKTLYEAMQSVERWQDDNVTQVIDSIFVDYLQRFRSTVGGDWVQFYGDLVNGLKEISGDFLTRMVLGVQAKREVDQRNIRVPEMDDGQWTSGIEQQSDGVITVCRPAHYVSQGAKFNDGIDEVEITDNNDMIIKVCKRKMGPENFLEWVKFKPQFNKLYEAEMKRYNPNMDIDNPQEARNVLRYK